MDPLDSRPPSVENFLHYYSSLVPTRYSYAQIRDYTNNLADQLGKGGFGTVYKGKLLGGPPIAIKILDESKHSEQQFIAEVASGEDLSCEPGAPFGLLLQGIQKRSGYMNTWLMVPRQICPWRS
jgi:serine/threonine protein kinase